MNAFRFAATASLLAVGLAAWAKPTLTTDEKRYDADEPVVFTLDNDSPDVVGWGSFGRHPVVYRELASGKREVVYDLPEIMDEGAVMLSAGQSAQWVWNQRARAEENDDDNGGAVPGEDPDGGIAVGEPNPNGDPDPAPTPMRGDGDAVRAGQYVAEFETFDEVYVTPEFEIRAPLAVEPAAKATVTWAALKAAQ